MNKLLQGQIEIFLAGSDIDQEQLAPLLNAISATYDNLVPDHKLLKEVFNSIQDGISVLDKDLNIIRVNGAMKKWYAHMRPLKGKKCYEAYHCRSKPCEICPTVRALKTNKLEMDLTPLTNEDGTIGTLELYAFPILDELGDAVGVVEYVRNITDRVDAQEKQSRLLDKLGKVNQELREFAYIVSHDLKAPLRGIISLADWLMNEYGDQLNEEGKDYLQLMGDRADKMQNLVDGILQYSRADRPAEQEAEVDINEVMAEVIELLECPEGIEITVEQKLPVIFIHEVKISQVFQNLLTNAIKYMGKPEGKISIGFCEQGGFLKFSVSDNGIGIAEEHYEKIFKLFQVINPTKDTESTGIGLTVIKKIIELYDGEIWVESQLGKGSTFFFTLPKTLLRGKNTEPALSTVG